MSVAVDESLRYITIMDQSCGWLDGRQRNNTSQFGEDGLIEAVLEKIGETNRWCFEVGASDGLFYSNTKRLRDAGWRAVLVEGNSLSFEKCRSFESPLVHVVHQKIKANSLDNILAGVGAPIRMDFGVIDIDGQDYWAWDGLRTFRPRVMLVEFMYLNENFHNPYFIPAVGEEGQAGLEAICDLGRSKGYTPIVSTYCNVLFVDKDAWASN